MKENNFTFQLFCKVFKVYKISVRRPGSVQKIINFDKIIRKYFLENFYIDI